MLALRHHNRHLIASVCRGHSIGGEGVQGQATLQGGDARTRVVHVCRQRRAASAHPSLSLSLSHTHTHTPSSSLPRLFTAQGRYVYACVCRWNGWRHCRRSSRGCTPRPPRYGPCVRFAPTCRGKAKSLKERSPIPLRTPPSLPFLSSVVHHTFTPIPLHSSPILIPTIKQHLFSPFNNNNNEPTAARMDCGIASLALATLPSR
jgi:hypothetical protein